VHTPLFCTRIFKNTFVCQLFLPKNLIRPHIIFKKTGKNGKNGKQWEVGQAFSLSTMKNSVAALNPGLKKRQ
jgi:hypothetical protein